MDKHDELILEQAKKDIEKNKVKRKRFGFFWRRSAKKGKSSFIAEIKLFNGNIETLKVTVKKDIKIFKYRDYYYCIMPEAMVYNTTVKMNKLMYYEGYSTPIIYKIDEKKLIEQSKPAMIDGAIHTSNFKEIVKGQVFQGLFTASKLISDKIKLLILIGVGGICATFASTVLIYLIFNGG